MRILLLFAIAVLYSSLIFSQTEIIAQQGFEVSGSSWGPLSYSTPPCSSGDDLWGVIDSLGPINPSQGSSFWGIQDLNGDCGSSGFEWIELPGVDVSDFRSVTCRMDVQVIGFDSGDDIELEPWFDGVPRERIVLIDGGSNFSTGGWIETEIRVPDAVFEFGLRIYVKQNGSDQAGIDNLRLEGLPVEPCSELLISEYVEGTSSTSHRNNFIEIHNASPETVSLDGYELVKYTGSNLEASSPLELEGNLGPYGTFLIEDVSENLGVTSDLSTSSSVMDFNGDDKIALRKDGSLVELIGIIGDSLDFGQDLVLRRKSFIKNPAREFNLSEWDVYGLEEIADLGRHQSLCSGPSPEIAVLGNSLEIPNGKIHSEFSDNTYFGYMELESSDITRNQFVILNLGNSLLELSRIEITGEHASDFSVNSAGSTSLSPGDSLIAEVSFSAKASGVRNALLRIENNDPSEPIYEFRIQGEGTSYTSSPLMISTYYEGEANNRWVEVTNISGEPTQANTHYLALFRQNLLNGPIGKRPSVKRVIPSMEPGETLKFRASLNVSQPEYALDGTEIATGVCGFNGDDVLVISASDDESCWENRLDIIGKNSPWGQDIAYVRKFGCEQENPHSGFHPGHWYPFGPNEIDNAAQGSPQRLGEYYRGETRFREGAWSNGLPSLYRNAVLEDEYKTSVVGGLRACNLQIAEGAELVVEKGDHIVIRNDLEVRGTLEIQNEGELLMLENTGRVLNEGEIRIQRWSSPLSKFDYTYWSSPVQKADLGSTFHGSNPDNFHTFSTALFSDQDGDGQDDNRDAWTATSGPMIPGNGYAILAPETLPEDKIQKAIFSGAPNNGLIEIPISLQGSENSDNDWNLIGNPYPSTLDAEALITDPSNAGLLGGTLYFWTHNTSLQIDPNTGEKTYSGSDYAIYTIGMGGVKAASGGPVPDGNIASGQGFFIEALAQGALTFNNEMRRVGQPSHFFKRTTNKGGFEAEKVWLNLSSKGGAFSQILIGFKEEATSDFDPYFDGRRRPANGQVEFYSKLGSDRLAIRGDPPLQGPETIPLGLEVKDPEIELLKISLDQLSESLDENGVYLHDRNTDILHNLKEGAYTFEISGKGIYEERFDLQFFDQELFPEEEANESLLPNRVLWSIENGVLHVRTRKNDEITGLKLFDMLGRVVISTDSRQKRVRVPAFSLSSNAVYVLRVATKNRGVLTAKILHLQP